MAASNIRDAIRAARISLGRVSLGLTREESKK